MKNYTVPRKYWRSYKDFKREEKIEERKGYIVGFLFILLVLVFAFLAGKPVEAF